MFPDKARILLAVSGGPDSMAMLDYFAKNAKNRNLQLIIAHVNHNLRGKASDGDAAFVQKKGKEYGLETHILSANVMEIAEKEGKLKIIEDSLANPGKNADIFALTAEYQEVKQSLDVLTEEWTAIMEQLDN